MSTGQKMTPIFWGMTFLKMPMGLQSVQSHSNKTRRVKSFGTMTFGRMAFCRMTQSMLTLSLRVYEHSCSNYHISTKERTIKAILPSAILLNAILLNVAAPNLRLKVKISSKICWTFTNWRKDLFFNFELFAVAHPYVQHY